jgi:hypothetical protein
MQMMTPPDSSYLGSRTTTPDLPKFLSYAVAILNVGRGVLLYPSAVSDASTSNALSPRDLYADLRHV